MRLFLFTLLTVTLGWAAGQTGMAFLKLPVDARSAAMGEAATAFASDATALYWNPALLAQNQTKSLVFMHSAYLADISQEFLAFQFATGKHKLAVGLNFMNIPGIEIRGTVPTEQPAGTTEALNLAATLGYARTIQNDWQIGLSLKYLYEKYYLSDAWGWAVDFGLFKRHFFYQNLDWGLTLQNLGKMGTLQVESTRLPLILRSGVLYHLPWQWKNQPLKMTVDFVYLISDEITHLKSGLEVPILRSLSGRLGMIYDWEDLRLTAGFGLKYKSYQFNYAYSPFPYDLGNAHRFSLSWWF